MSPLRKSVCIEAAVPRRAVGLPDVTEPRAHAGEEYVHVEWREREHKCAEGTPKGRPKGDRRDVGRDVRGTSLLLLLFNTTRTLSGPPSTGVTITMDGGVADTAGANTNTRMNTSR